MQLKTTIWASPDINRWLREPRNEFECLGEDEKIINGALFPDGCFIEVQMCGVKYEEGTTNAAWTQAILFDPQWDEVTVSEVGDTYFGEWTLEYNGNKYTVEVKEQTMKESEKRSPFRYNLHNTDELRQLILDNPDLPLVVLATEDANIGGSYAMFCSDVRASIGEILDCDQQIDDEVTFVDREAFEDRILDNIEVLTGYDDRPEDWYEKEAKRIAKEYDPYWKKCILLTVGN